MLLLHQFANDLKLQCLSALTLHCLIYRTNAGHSKTGIYKREYGYLICDYIELEKVLLKNAVLAR